jgi:hydroxymethylpyrimidine pyrophosphatase-like HAD family hydrolase
MLKPPRLVALDLDGTVLNSDGVASARTIAAIRAFSVDHRELGVRIALCTGRETTSTRPVYELVGADFCVCGNGALIVDEKFNTARANWVPSRSAGAILSGVESRWRGQAVCVDLDFDANFYDSSPAFLEMMGKFLGEGAALHVDYTERTTVVEGIGALQRVLAARGETQRITVGVFGIEPQELAREVASIVEAAAPSLEVALAVKPSGLDMPGFSSVEISREGGGKREALRYLCSRLGLADDGSDVLAFGDGSNDDEMLAWAGRSIAPANGQPGTKAVAKSVSGLTNDDDFVAAELERLLAELLLLVRAKL